MFFNNAQAATKSKTVIQETMFIAYPDSISQNVQVDDDFDMEITEAKLPTTVHAFAGASHSEKDWEEKILPALTYKEYVEEYMLSDHGPVYVDFTDDNQCTYRFLFGNCASLLNPSMGIVSNGNFLEI